MYLKVCNKQLPKRYINDESHMELLSLTNFEFLPCTPNPEIKADKVRIRAAEVFDGSLGRNADQT